MGTHGFMPRTDAGLLAFANAFSQQIDAAPATFGVPVLTATNLVALTGAYSDAYAEATNESTRTKGKVAAKNSAKLALRQAISDVAKLVYGTSTVSDEQLANLGLTVRDAHPTPVEPPALAPLLTLVSVTGRTARYKLADAAFPETRRRPINAVGATIFSHVGENPPTTGAEGWTYEGQTGRTTFIIQFPDGTEPGAKCWATACWYTARGATSPACQPVLTYLQAGATAEAA